MCPQFHISSVHNKCFSVPRESAVLLCPFPCVLRVVLCVQWKDRGKLLRAVRDCNTRNLVFSCVLRVVLCVRWKDGSYILYKGYKGL